MRRKTITGTLLLAPITAVLAVITGSFESWDWIKEKSPDIIIAQCSKTPTQSYGLVVYSDIEVVKVLKGTNSLGPSVLWSLYWPRQGETYLIFANYHDGGYQAIEEYRLVPLGVDFSTNSIVGKSFDEQVRVLLSRRLWHLNRELEQGKEEKKRLEEGLRK